MQLNYKDGKTQELSQVFIRFFLWITHIIRVHRIENLSKHYYWEVKVWVTFLIKEEMAFGIPLCEIKKQTPGYIWLILHICS